MARSGGKISVTMIAGLGCTLLFFGLLAVRLGFFQETQPTPLPITRKTPATYTWHEIFQESEKIGYSHRRMIPLDNGYRLSETTFMRINTMGMVQDINLLTTGTLEPDMSLSAFTFELKSSRFNFKASGKVAADTIELNINGQPSTLAVKTPIYLTAGIFDAVSAVDIKVGETRAFNIFDPSSMSQRPIRVTFTGLEKMNVLGKEINTRKLETDFMGAKHTAWVTLKGEVVQETGPLGITLKKSDARQAFKNVVGPTRDLTRLVAVDPGSTLRHIENLKQITYKFDGLPDMADINGGRQSLQGQELTVTLEGPLARDDTGQTDYLAATPFVQSDHPEIRALAQNLIAGHASDRDRVAAIKNWVYAEIEKRPVLSVPNALETFTNRMGDCNEHSVLFAALARAAGIPTRIEAGLVYLKGRFFYHAWNAVLLDGWVTVDALMNQFPADVTHIRFTIGGLERQMDLMGVIGNINLKVIDTQYD